MKMTREQLNKLKEQAEKDNQQGHLKDVENSKDYVLDKKSDKIKFVKKNPFVKTR